MTLRSAAATDYANVAPTFDAVLNGVSLRHPGFKGVVGSDDGSRTLVLLDPLALADVPALIADLARTLGTSPAALVASPLPALAASRPDFHELYAVKTALRRFLFETNLVHTLDLEETTGRVEVGTTTAADADRVRDQTTPAERAAVEFVHAEPALLYRKAPASSLRSLRNDRFDPLIGGAQIDFPGSNGGFSTCTQGPAVRYNESQWGFLTASHCTGDKSRVTGRPFYQPFVRSSDLIGIETAEQPYRSGWFITDGYYADVAFVRTQSGVGLQGKMTSADRCFDSGCFENGIITSIPGTVSYVTNNVRVFKTGAETGTTAGVIIDTCIDAGTTLCSNLVEFDPALNNTGRIASFGDSGAPVLLNQGSPGTNVGSLSGVLWGAPNTRPFTQFYYSPWENIWQSERAGTRYGLPLSVVTASQGTVANSSSGGGSGGGSGEDPVECSPDALTC